MSPLALPDCGATRRDLDALSRVDAVALFCERARAHDPRLELSADNAGAVTEICRRLDGLPLAIELAAARCGLLSPSEIAARLEVALSALAAGPAMHPLASGRCGRPSTGAMTSSTTTSGRASPVWPCSPGAPPSTRPKRSPARSLDTLDRLVAKSLLIRRRARHGQTRLGMLETVREYAGERFAALPDREAVRERHFAYCLRVARHHGLDSALYGPDAREHLACLDDELENLRAALRFTAERDAAERMLELSAALVDYWQRRDRHAEAAQWILLALQKTAAGADPTLRARALGKAFWPLWDLRRGDELMPLLTEAEALARTVPDLVIRAEVLYNCAAIQGCTGRQTRRSRPPTTRSAPRTPAATHGPSRWPRGPGRSRRPARGAGRAHRRDSAAADRRRQCLPLASAVVHRGPLGVERNCDADASGISSAPRPSPRRLDQPSRWLHMLDDLGLAALLRGDATAADNAFREALTLSHDLGFGPQPVALIGLAALAAVQDRPEPAARLAGAVAAHIGATDNAVQTRLEATFLEPARLRCGPDNWEAPPPGKEPRSASEEATLYALEQPPVHARRPPDATPAPTAHAG